MDANHIHDVRRAAVLRRRWRRLVSALIALVGVMVILTLGGWALSRSTPLWWRAIDRNDPALRERATALENGAVTTLYDRPPAPLGSPWVAAIREEDALAWLNAKMPEWAVGSSRLREWPAEVREIIPRFADGRIEIGVHIVAKDGSAEVQHFLSISLTPRVDEGGQLWLAVDSVSVGRLPVPAGMVFSSASATGTGVISAEGRVPASLRGLPELGSLSRVLAGREPLLKAASMKLGDGRTVQLTGVDTKDGKLLLRCITRSGSVAAEKGKR